MSAKKSKTFVLAAACVMTIIGVRAAGQTYSVLYTFTGGAVGIYPNGLIQDGKGNLYGTTQYGGGHADSGTIFRLNQTGKITVLYTFTGGADGGNPYAGVTLDGNNNLYGTTLYGGDNSCPGGCGTVFRLSKPGTVIVLHRFTGGADGASPQAGLTVDAKGNLYGTTSGGGNTACLGGCGVVFKLDPTGKETVLYSFKGGADGEYPFGGVIRDSDGNLYGTTANDGGTGCGGYGCGVVFKLDTTSKETLLHAFTGGEDGGNPYAGVIQDTLGNLYGTTYGGGASSGGTVFALDATNNLIVLHSFGQGTDGVYPEAGLIRDANGDLYGTTYNGGGPDWAGTVFKLGMGGIEEMIHSFTGRADGGNPVAGVIRDAKGNIYGATSAGGDLSCGIEGSGCGVLFRITP